MPIKYISRANDITTQLKKKSVLLLGPRRTGKSAFIRNELQPDHSYNLLQADTFQVEFPRKNGHKASGDQTSIFVALHATTGPT